MNPADGLHCIGASHQRNDSGTEYREEEQTANKQRLLTSLPDVSWPEMVDISAGASRQGIRCTLRDHLPLAGNVPDFAELTACYAHLDEQKSSWKPYAVYRICLSCFYWQLSAHGGYAPPRWRLKCWQRRFSVRPFRWMMTHSRPFTPPVSMSVNC